MEPSMLEFERIVKEMAKEHTLPRDKYIGEYKDDSPWKGTSYNKKGNILEEYVNGNRIF